jgi:hypothetical protein
VAAAVGVTAELHAVRAIERTSNKESRIFREMCFIVFTFLGDKFDGEGKEHAEGQRHATAKP